jgi:hypothetical protein
MAYYFNPDNSGMTYDRFKSAHIVLIDLIKSEGDLLEDFFHRMRLIQGWHIFFNPTITITEVNNKNMGHIYLGKFRIPVAFSKKRGPNNQPIPHVITFVVCKYEGNDGENNKEYREREAYRIAMEKLSIHYPERFGEKPEVAEYETKKAAEEVREFLSKWGLSD